VHEADVGPGLEQRDLSRMPISSPRAPASARFIAATNPWFSWRSTVTRGWLPNVRSSSSPVPSREPSSTTTTSSSPAG
jgi:hypothetical protein